MRYIHKPSARALLGFLCLLPFALAAQQSRRGQSFLGFREEGTVLIRVPNPLDPPER